MDTNKVKFLSTLLQGVYKPTVKAIAEEQILASDSVVHNVADYTSLQVIDFTKVTKVNLTELHPDIKESGGTFIWNPLADKATANQGTRIDPSVSLTLQGTGVGLGCWERQIHEADYVNMRNGSSVQFEIETKRAKDGKRFELIAHRGFGNQYPQNTLLAMSSALDSGADSLETDVSVSSDGELYLFHDTTVEALTDGTGTFTALASTTIDALIFDELAGTFLSDEGIPKFADFLALAKKKNVYVYPEIKNIRSTADIDLIVQAVEDAGMEDLCMLQSFTFSDLEYVRNTIGNKKIALGFVGGWVANWQEIIMDLNALRGGSLLWSFTDLLANPEVITYATSNNVGVVAWAINTDYDLSRLTKIGVNRIMADIKLGGTR